MNATKNQNAESILSKKAMLACPTISQWTARKYDRKITNDLHRQKHMSEDSGRYNKYLLATDDLEEVTRINGRARAYHLESTLSWMDQEGQRLLPSAKYLEYMNTMRGYKREHEKAVADFVAKYPTYVEEARKRLNGAFDPNDYPHQSMIRSKFRFEITILPVPSSDFRCEITSEEAKHLEEDVRDRMQDALERTQKDALERAAKLLKPMVEKLKKYKPANAKGQRTEGKFHDTLVENVREFVPLLRAFNFANDKAINDLADQIDTDLCAIDAKELRDDAKKRKVVATSAEKILASVEQFMA